MYIDPNTGGMLFQVLAVVFAALSGFVLFFSGKIRMYFAKLKRRVREGSEEQGEDLSGADTDLT
jgi:hypothetical protein